MVHPAEVQSYFLPCVQYYFISSYVNTVRLQVDVYVCVRPSIPKGTLPTGQHIIQALLATSLTTSFILMWDQPKSTESVH
jgi:hypothetical protein